MVNIVMTGASRGLGSALIQGLAEAGDRSWLVSRTEPPGCDGLPCRHRRSARPSVDLNSAVLLVRLSERNLRPVADMLALVQCITRMSAGTCIKELTTTGTADPDI